MSLPPNFSGMPVQEQCNYFLNVCLEAKKTIRSSKNIPVLEKELERFLNASKEVNWPHHQSGTYHKDEIEKAVQNVVTHFRRYLQALEKDPDTAQHEDLLHSFALVEGYIDQLKVR